MAGSLSYYFFCKFPYTLELVYLNAQIDTNSLRSARAFSAFFFFLPFGVSLLTFKFLLLVEYFIHVRWLATACYDSVWDQRRSTFKLQFFSFSLILKETKKITWENKKKISSNKFQRRSGMPNSFLLFQDLSDHMVIKIVIFWNKCRIPFVCVALNVLLKGKPLNKGWHLGKKN